MSDSELPNYLKTHMNTSNKDSSKQNVQISLCENLLDFIDVLCREAQMCQLIHCVFNVCDETEFADWRWRVIKFQIEFGDVFRDFDEIWGAFFENVA